MKKIHVIKNKKLPYLLKKKIFKLKSSFWNFNLHQQNIWHKKIIYDDDIHVILTLEKNVIGYVMLRSREFFYLKNINKKKKYLYFDTLIIDKSFRGLNYSNILIKKTISLSKKLKVPMILLCKKETIQFYKKYKWKLLNKNNVRTVDHKSNNSIMCFDKFQNEKIKKNKIDIYINHHKL